MNQRITVVAVDGRSIPMEGVPGTIGAEPVEVNTSHYYRSRIAAGELRQVDVPAPESTLVLPQSEGGPAASADAGDAAAGADTASTDSNPTSSNRRNSR